MILISYEQHDKISTSTLIVNQGVRELSFAIGVDFITLPFVIGFDMKLSGLVTVGSDNLVFILVDGDDCGCIYVMAPKKRQVSTLWQNPFKLSVPCVYDLKVDSVRVAGARMIWRLLKLKCKQTGERSQLPL